MVPNFDAIDQKIFEQLAQNGRESNLELARRLRVSEKTIRQRIRRLIERDGMRIVATMKHSSAQSRAIFLLHTESGQRFLVANRLANLPEVDEVHLATGAYELIIQASFDSDAEALEFYVRHIEAAPGVRDAQSTHIIETVMTDHTAALIEEFETLAEPLHDLSELLDLTCTIATAHFGTNRIAVGRNAVGEESVAPLFEGNPRWRGLSSRYIEALCAVRSSESVIIPNVLERGQHLFISDAQTDPMFRSISDLVTSEGFHSFLAVPVRSDDVSQGTMNLYYDAIIPYNPELVANAQQLADALGKHIARCLHEATRLVAGQA